VGKSSDIDLNVEIGGRHTAEVEASRSRLRLAELRQEAAEAAAAEAAAALKQQEHAARQWALLTPLLGKVS
jgi:hypothetical protein